jgi:hypothetical protein
VVLWSVIHTWHRAHCVAGGVTARDTAGSGNQQEEARGALKNKKANGESDVHSPQPQKQSSYLLHSRGAWDLL